MPLRSASRGFVYLELLPLSEARKDALILGAKGVGLFGIPVPLNCMSAAKVTARKGNRRVDAFQSIELHICNG